MLKSWEFKVSRDKTDISKLEPIELLREETKLTFYETLKLKYLYVKIAYYLLKLIYYIGKEMDNSLTTKFANRSFWAGIIGVLSAILGLFLSPEAMKVLSSNVEAIISFLVATASLILALFFNKKEGQSAKDAQ